MGCERWKPTVIHSVSMGEIIHRQYRQQDCVKMGERTTISDEGKNRRLCVSKHTIVKNILLLRWSTLCVGSHRIDHFQVDQIADIERRMGYNQIVLCWNGFIQQRNLPVHFDSKTNFQLHRDRRHLQLFSIWESERKDVAFRIDLSLRRIHLTADVF